MAPVLGLLLITLLSASTTSTGAVNCSSSCGGVIISDPFRLAGDPSSCGSSFYELSCRNNRASLYLNSQEYAVEFISDDNQTIRVLDLGLRSNNCSALPKSSLSAADLELNRSYTFVTDYIRPDYFVTYLRCTHSMDAPPYVVTGPCINSSSSAYFYLLVGAAVRDLVVESCTSIATLPRNSATMVGNPTT